MPRTTRPPLRAATLRLWTTLPALAVLLPVTGCSEKTPPKEQELHASDSGVATGEMGRHLYRCDDGKPLFVDLKDGGLRIEIRRSSDGPATTLTAPAAGLQYVGDTSNVTLAGLKLTISDSVGVSRTCAREVHR